MCIRFCPTKEKRSFPRSICSATVCKWCAGWILVRMLPTASHMDRAWLAGWIGSTRYSRYMYAELDWWLRSRNWQAFLLNDCLPEWFGKSTLDWLNDGPLITIIIIYLGILHHQFISFITGHILQYVTWRLEIELTSISNIFYHCRCPSGCVFCLFVDPNYDWSPTFHSDDANTLNVTQVSYVFLSMTDSFFITINIIIPFWFVNNPFIDRGPSVASSPLSQRQPFGPGRLAAP